MSTFPSFARIPHRALTAATLAALASLLASCGPEPGSQGPAAATVLLAAAPARLADTGLYADFASRRLAPDVLAFAPQYPLWTDGAAKRRWIALPRGAAIDASELDSWRFPIGTRFWKEFAFGRAVETRFMLKLADGSWLYATYAWTADGSDAVLAPEHGVRGACETTDGQRHDIPGVLDCRLCHEGNRTPVLGFGALQLSPDRDPLAPHAAPPDANAVDLRTLAARGLVRNLPAEVLANPPRIDARTPVERAALGYLHGNCSACHNAAGPLQRLGLRFDYPLQAHGPAPGITSTLAVPSSFTRWPASLRIAPGDPEHSVVVQRLSATDALTQMPPFGRHLVDRDAKALVEQWIRDDLGQNPSRTTDQPTPQRKEKGT